MDQNVLRQRLQEIMDSLSAVKPAGAAGQYQPCPPLGKSPDEMLDNLRLQMKYMLFDLRKPVSATDDRASPQPGRQPAGRVLRSQPAGAGGGLETRDSTFEFPPFSIVPRRHLQRADRPKKSFRIH